MSLIIIEVFGTNRLLKRGGILVTSAKEIIQSFPELKYQEKKEKEEVIFVPQQYKPIYILLEKRPMNANEIARKQKKTIQEVLNLLFFMEMDGYIQKIDTGEYKIRKEE